MTTFDEREKAFEALYVHEQDFAFRARARRDRRIGAWAAELLGKTSTQAEDYAAEIIARSIKDGGGRSCRATDRGGPRGGRGGPFRRRHQASHGGDPDRGRGADEGRIESRRKAGRAASCGFVPARLRCGWPQRRRASSGDRSMAFTSVELLKILDLETIEQDIYRGTSPQVGWQRVFGGLVVAQALVAAARTVGASAAAFPAWLFHAAGRPLGPDRLSGGPAARWRHLHHAQLLCGDPAWPADLYLVGLVPRGGAGVSTMPPRCRVVPQPEDLPGEAEIMARFAPRMPEPVRLYFQRERPIEMRPVDFGRFAARDGGNTELTQKRLDADDRTDCPTIPPSMRPCWPICRI